MGAKVRIIIDIVSLNGKKKVSLAVEKVRLSPVQKQLLSCRFSPVFPMLRRPAWKAALPGHYLSSSFLW